VSIFIQIESEDTRRKCLVELGINDTNGRALKAIKERISGKEGLIRSNLMGDEKVWVLF
jgi:DNA-directed RNA polymerase beta' subunit